MTHGTFFFAEPLRVINIGIEVFAEDLKEEGVEVVHLDWRPPTGGDPHLAALLARLEDEE
jgi:FdrA protein